MRASRCFSRSVMVPRGGAGRFSSCARGGAEMRSRSICSLLSRQSSSWRAAGESTNMKRDILFLPSSLLNRTDPF